jgi:dATP pyrophosphohydrolase
LAATPSSLLDFLRLNVRPYKTPISVLVVIYFHPVPDEKSDAVTQVLLLERADHAEAWQSVTGSVETNESLIETAAREVLEETGIVASAHQLSDWQQQNHYEIYTHWRHRYAPDVTHNTEHVFGLQLTQRVPITLSPREHLSYQWLSWQAAAQKVFSPSNRAAILQLGAHTH